MSRIKTAAASFIRKVYILTSILGIAVTASCAGKEFRSEAKVELKPVRSESSFMFELPTYYITTADRHPRMGTLSISIEINPEIVSRKTVNSQIEIMNRAVDGLLRNKKQSDLNSPEAIERLRAEIKMSLNSELKLHFVKSVTIRHLNID